MVRRMVEMLRDMYIDTVISDDREDVQPPSPSHTPTYIDYICLELDNTMDS